MRSSFVSALMVFFLAISLDLNGKIVGEAALGSCSSYMCSMHCYVWKGTWKGECVNGKCKCKTKQEGGATVSGVKSPKTQK